MVPRYTFGANLGIPAHKYDELSRSQARFGWIWTILAPNDLEGQGQLAPFSTGFWGVPRYTFDAYLVTLARKREELSWSQAAIYRQTDGRTDRRRQRQYPFGRSGRGVKTEVILRCIFCTN